MPKHACWNAELAIPNCLRSSSQGRFAKNDEKRMWIYKAQEKRADNLICAAVVEEDRLIVKTVMINWQLVG